MSKGKILTTLLALGLSLACPALSAAEPCPSVRLQRASQGSDDALAMQPAPPNVVDCVSGVPLEVERGATLWRCVVETPDGQEPIWDEWTDALLLVRDGEWTRAWQDSVMAGRYDAFHVATADLDGDGTPERIVATWNAQGNGLGVNHWTIRVFSQLWDEIGLYRDVQDWGPSSIVAAPSYRTGCDLAITRYVEANEDAEAPGLMMLEARFSRMTAGRMVNATDRERLYKRLTTAFQRQREAHFERLENDVEGDVAAWLEDERPR